MLNPNFYVTINAISCVNNSFFMDFKRLNDGKILLFFEIDTTQKEGRRGERERERQRKRKSDINKKFSDLKRNDLCTFYMLKVNRRVYFMLYEYILLLSRLHHKWDECLHGDFVSSNVVRIIRIELGMGIGAKIHSRLIWSNEPTKPPITWIECEPIHMQNTHSIIFSVFHKNGNIHNGKMEHTQNKNITLIVIKRERKSERGSKKDTKLLSIWLLVILMQ